MFLLQPIPTGRNEEEAPNPWSDGINLGREGVQVNYLTNVLNHVLSHYKVDNFKAPDINHAKSANQVVNIPFFLT